MATLLSQGCSFTAFCARIAALIRLRIVCRSTASPVYSRIDGRPVIASKMSIAYHPNERAAGAASRSARASTQLYELPARAL